MKTVKQLEEQLLGEVTRLRKDLRGFRRRFIKLENKLRFFPPRNVKLDRTGASGSRSTVQLDAENCPPSSPSLSTADYDEAFDPDFPTAVEDDANPNSLEVSKELSEMMDQTIRELIHDDDDDGKDGEAK